MQLRLLLEMQLLLCGSAATDLSALKTSPAQLCLGSRTPLGQHLEIEVKFSSCVKIGVVSPAQASNDSTSSQLVVAVQTGKGLTLVSGWQKYLMCCKITNMF